MTEDIHTTYETIDSLQLSGNYSELKQIAQYAIDAIINDGRYLRLRLPTNIRKVTGTEDRN